MTAQMDQILRVMQEQRLHKDYIDIRLQYVSTNLEHLQRNERRLQIKLKTYTTTT